MTDRAEVIWLTMLLFMAIAKATRLPDIPSGFGDAVVTGHQVRIEHAARIIAL